MHSQTTEHVLEEVRVPLCVDLDGTLIKSDLLVEGFLRSCKQNVFNAFRAIWWMFRGKAYLKERIACMTSVDPALLPANSSFVSWLQSERVRGRRLVLCTSANMRVAESVAAHFGIFEGVISSDATQNLTGRAKAAALEQAFGKENFDYAGNESQDIHVWRSARRAVVVEPTWRLRSRIDEVPRIERTFSSGTAGWASTWVRALRVHQWAKNLLIFLPVLAAHRFLDPAALLASVLAFACFGLCASATYLVNDLLDLDSDRAHSRKSRRPFASGEIPLTHGIVAAGILLLAAFVVGTLGLGLVFIGTLTLYLIGTLWYSFALKRVAMVDVLALAGLYTVRVLAGGAAIAVVPSFWLLAFSMFMFFSLATVKRYTELRVVLAAGRTSAAGRGYTTDDLPLLLASGTSSGFVAVLVLALYINLGAEPLYRYPEALWLVCPLILYWITRVWRKTHRGELHDDPVVFAIRDRPSLVVAGLCTVLLLLAI